MRFLVQLAFIILLGWLLELFMPWWCVAIAGFAGGLFFKTNNNFSSGFLAIGLLWLIRALLIDAAAATDLIRQVAEIFRVNRPVLLAITPILGGLVGGFASLTGSLVRSRKRDHNPYKL